MSFVDTTSEQSDSFTMQVYVPLSLLQNILLTSMLHVVFCGVTSTPSFFQVYEQFLFCAHFTPRVTLSPGFFICTIWNGSLTSFSSYTLRTKPHTLDIQL